MTVYKGLKETEVKPGEWVVISGIGGLGHMAVQYAKAMGMHVAAVDVHPDKLELAKSLGAEIAINAQVTDLAAEMQRLVAAPTARSSPPYRLRHSSRPSTCCGPTARCHWSACRRARCRLPIFHTVLKRITVRGSIVGTRQDLEEALDFAGRRSGSAHFSWDKLENINDIFARMEAGKIDGRIVVKMQ